MYLCSLLSAATVLDTVEPIFKWLTVAILAAAILTGALLFFFKRAVFAKFVRLALLGVFIYLLALAIAFFSLDIAAHYSDEYAKENWLDKKLLVRLLLIPLLVLCCICLGSLLTIALTGKFRPEKKKAVTVCCAVCFFIALVALLICIAVYYDKKIKGDGYYNSDTASVKQLALYLGALLAVGLIVGLSFTDKRKLQFDSRSVAYAGICAAMSFALSYIKLWDMPQGGSITLVSLLPVMVYAYIFGAKKGVFVGFAYGLLQAVQDPWIIHPAQMLLDYPVAFAAAGLAGVFKDLPVQKKLPQLTFTLGALLGGTMRFVCHVLSGSLAFEAYAGGKNAWIYSLAYNSYVFIDIALVIVAGVIVFSSKAFTKATEKLDKKTVQE